MRPPFVPLPTFGRSLREYRSDALPKPDEYTSGTQVLLRARNEYSRASLEQSGVRGERLYIWVVSSSVEEHLGVIFLKLVPGRRNDVGDGMLVDIGVELRKRHKGGREGGVELWIGKRRRLAVGEIKGYVRAMCTGWDRELALQCEYRLTASTKCGLRTHLECRSLEVFKD